jgi:predicted murein hydrolase (TIGR00659 family)
VSVITRSLDSPVFAIAITLGLYWLSLHLQKRWQWASPLVTASGALVFLLFILRIPYASYQTGGNFFTYLLGPATVALGVPMYKQGVKLKGALRRLLVVVLAGSVVGMVTAGVVAWLCGASREVIMSTLPKSVTTPIAIQISTELHGNPAITAAMVLVTGVLGSIAGPPVLRMAHILHDHAHGAAIGTSSHAVGTASLMRHSEVQGSVSSLAMAMAGVITSILAMLITCFRH